VRKSHPGWTLLYCLFATLAAHGAPANSQAIIQSAETLSLQTVRTPQPAAGQVLIKVYAAAINPVDWKRRARIPGFDAAGVIDSVGPGVSAWKPGDAVFALANGAYTQYALAGADNVVAKPKSFTFAEAAAIPIAGVAAYRAVEEAHVAAGQRVVIIGAAGGVGSFAVQLAKARGARVVAVGHSSQQAFLQGLGSDEFVAYDKDDVAARVGKADAALNLVDGQADAALGYVKRGGHLTSIAGDPGSDKCAAAGVACVIIAGGNGAISYPQGMRAMATLAAQGQYKVLVTKTFPLGEAMQAQQAVHGEDAMGKVVLIVDAARANTR
jgi:NADPH:quinone reductase-like Zn-dependent oxidoreductase